MAEQKPTQSTENEATTRRREWDMQRMIATVISLVVALGILFLGVITVKSWTEQAAKQKETERQERQAKEQENDATTLPPSTPTVTVRKVENKSIQSGFSVQGRLRAYEKTDIIAEVPGIMKNTLEKRFKIGTRYQDGEVMVDIEDTEARINLKAAKAQLETAITAMMPDLKLDMPESFNQWKAYLDKYSVSQPIRPFPQPKSDREAYYVSTKNLNAQYYNIKAAEHRLTKYQVRAPFDGILTASYVNEGGYIRAGTPLGTLMNTQTFELEAAIQMANLKYIQTGSRVKVVSDDTGKSWTGRVKRISDVVDVNSQSAIVYIGLSGKGLREGQYLRAVINTSAIAQAIRIPRIWLTDENQVFTVQDQTLQLQKVQVERIDGDDAIIRGLENGTALLAEPITGAFDGMKVKVE